MRTAVLVRAFDHALPFVRDLLAGVAFLNDRLCRSKVSTDSVWLVKVRSDGLAPVLHEDAVLEWAKAWQLTRHDGNAARQRQQDPIWRFRKAEGIAAERNNTYIGALQIDMDGLGRPLHVFGREWQRLNDLIVLWAIIADDDERGLILLRQLGEISRQPQQ